MQMPSSSLVISTSQHSTSMGTDNRLSCESFSCSFRLSFDAESFIEFDLKLTSMRWSIKAMEEVISEHSSLELDSVLMPSLSVDSAKSLISHSVRHQPLPVYSHSTQSKHHKSFQRYFWFLLTKLCRKMRGLRMAKGIEGRSSVKVVSMERGKGKKACDVDTEFSIQDAVLHCKNSNLSSLTMDQECRA